MPYRIEDRDGLHVIEVWGEITAAESREHFRVAEDFLQRRSAFVLLVYGPGCSYLAGPRETLQLHLAVAESIGDFEGGAMAFLCPEDEIFGICRQFQFLASGSGIRLAVFRDGPQAEDWLVCRRREASESAWRF